MHQLKTAIRLALCVGLIASAAVWLALSLGVLKNPAASDARHRLTVTRYVSLIASSLINSNRSREVNSTMEQLVSFEPSLVSIGIHDYLGRVFTAGPHNTAWTQPSSSLASNARTDQKNGEPNPDLPANQVSVELTDNERVYGKIELVFKSEISTIWGMIFGFPVPLAVFVGTFVTLMSWIIFERSFKYLDPSQVVPDRVRSALDTMAEGVVLLDTQNEIGHANDAFAQIVGGETQRLLGTSIFEYKWSQSSDFGTKELPWAQALKEQRPVCGVVVRLLPVDAPARKFIVNATPIVSDKNECRGVLVSFEDITAMENKKHELSQMVATLRQSRDEVERQNTKLNFLASYDQLTECMNRRVFFQRLESTWADESVADLSVIMMDVDHFKSVNDNHGHGKGDEVLKEVGRLLRDSVANRGIVARVGGEEFVVLLPHISLGPATLIAEEIRSAVRDKKIGGLSISISLGVSARELRPMDTQHLLDQADQALYVAKESGRDRVVRYDQKETSSNVSGTKSSTTDSLAEDSLDQAEQIANEVQTLVKLTGSESKRSLDQSDQDQSDQDQSDQEQSDQEQSDPEQPDQEQPDQEQPDSEQLVQDGTPT